MLAVVPQKEEQRLKDARELNYVKIFELHEILAPLLRSQWVVLLFGVISIFVWSSNAICLGSSELLAFDLLLVKRSLLGSKERSLHELKAGFSKHGLSALFGTGIATILRLECLFRPNLELCVVKSLIDILVFSIKFKLVKYVNDVIFQILLLILLPNVAVLLDHAQS